MDSNNYLDFSILVSLFVMSHAILHGHSKGEPVYLDAFSRKLIILKHFCFTFIVLIYLM